MPWVFPCEDQCKTIWIPWFMNVWPNYIFKIIYGSMTTLWTFVSQLYTMHKAWEVKRSNPILQWWKASVEQWKWLTVRLRTHASQTNVSFFSSKQHKHTSAAENLSVSMITWPKICRFNCTYSGTEWFLPTFINIK